MKYLESIWWRGKLAVAVLAAWLVIHGAALAQVEKDRGTSMMPKAATQSGSYVYSYTLVILGVGLGVFMACRPSHRRERARPEEYVTVVKEAASK